MEGYDVDSRLISASVETGPFVVHRLDAGLRAVLRVGGCREDVSSVDLLLYP